MQKKRKLIAFGNMIIDQWVSFLAIEPDTIHGSENIHSQLKSAIEDERERLVDRRMLGQNFICSVLND